MSELRFLNIYSGTPPQGKTDSNPEPALWNVYLNEEEHVYLIQKLDGKNKPTAEKYKISPAYFGINFRQISDSELKHAVDANLGRLNVDSADKEKNEAFLNSLFSSRSAFNATVRKSKTAKKTGKSAFQKKNEEAKLNDKQGIRDFGLETLPRPEEIAQGEISRKNPSTSANVSSEQKNKEKNALTDQIKKNAVEHGTPLKPVPSIRKTAENGKNLETSASIAKQGSAASKIKTVDAITKTENALLPAKGGTLSISEKAQKLDTALRAEFQAGMTQWNSAKKNPALRHFYEVINRQADFVPAHKHTFTDFAIQLRKINQHELALGSAIRCTKLSPDDSHAFFNVSRLFYELGRYDEANRFIDNALKLESDLEPAIRLSEVIKECMRRKAKNR